MSSDINKKGKSSHKVRTTTESNRVRNRVRDGNGQQKDLNPYLVDPDGPKPDIAYICPSDNEYYQYLGKGIQYVFKNVDNPKLRYVDPAIWKDYPWREQASPRPNIQQPRSARTTPPR